MSNSETALDFVRQSYAWIARVGAREVPLTAEGMRRSFTDDVRMIVNNEVKADGIVALRERLEEMLQKTSSWEVEILTPSLSTKDRAAAYCHYRFRDNDGNSGLVHTGTIWTLRDGRIAEVAEVAHFENLPLDIESHGPTGGDRIFKTV